MYYNSTQKGGQTVDNFRPKEAEPMTFADLLARLIEQNQELIRENERLKEQIKKSASAATEAQEADS